jgi:hypothetical protein
MPGSRYEFSFVSNLGTTSRPCSTYVHVHYLSGPALEDLATQHGVLDAHPPSRA